MFLSVGAWNLKKFNPEILNFETYIKDTKRCIKHKKVRGKQY